LLFALQIDILLLSGYATHAAAYGVNEVLSPGRYKVIGASTHSGVLTLNGGGDPNSEFIFITTTTHAVAASASIVLTNNAHARNVFFYALGAISTGANAIMSGTYISAAAFTIGAGTVLKGRLLTSSGAITTTTITAEVPTGTNASFTLGMLQDTQFYTATGAISTTGYTNGIPSYSWRILTDLGAVSGFGAPYDGTYPNSNTPLIAVKIELYSGAVLIDTFTINKNTISDYNNLNMGSTILVDSTAKKTITIKTYLTTIFGGIIFKNRSLFLQPLLPF
jgi:hypothetical protein